MTAPSLDETAPQGDAMVTTDTTTEAHAALGEIDAFYRHEIVLLQDRRYDEWLELFSNEIRYWMPTRRTVSDLGAAVHGTNATPYFDDTHDSLSIRVKRMTNPNAFTEIPPPVLRYFLQVLTVTPTGTTLDVTSNELVLHTRGRTTQLFSAQRRDRLRRENHTLQVIERQVVLDERVLVNKNLSFFF